MCIDFGLKSLKVDIDKNQKWSPAKMNIAATKASREASSDSEECLSPPTPDHFGIWIKARRASLRLSLREAAFGVGVSPTAFHNWELGKSRPRRSKLAAIAEVLAVSQSELLARSNGYSKNEAPEIAVIWAASDAPMRLSDVIDICKEKVATAAGTTSSNIKIVIEI